MIFMTGLNLLCFQHFLFKMRSFLKMLLEAKWNLDFI